MYDFGFGCVACGSKSHGRYFGSLGVGWSLVGCSLFFLHLGLIQIRQGLDELHSLALGGVFLLEDGVELVLFVVGHSCLFLNVDGINESLWVVHVAPADHASVVGEGRKLVFFYVFIDRLLDIEVTAGHFCNLLLKLLQI